MVLLQCLNPLLFTESDAAATTVVLTKGAEVKRMTGRGKETLPLYWVTMVERVMFNWAVEVFVLKKNSRNINVC